MIVSAIQSNRSMVEIEFVICNGAFPCSHRANILCKLDNSSVWLSALLEVEECPASLAAGVESRRSSIGLFDSSAVFLASSAASCIASRVVSGVSLLHPYSSSVTVTIAKTQILIWNPLERVMVSFQ